MAAEAIPNDEAKYGETNAGEPSEIVFETDTFAGELEYVNSSLTPVKRRKRKVGRPTLQEAAREKTRLRVQRWRDRQISGKEKEWQTNLAALPEEERSRLLAQQAEVSLLQGEMNEVIDGKIAPDLFPDCLYVRVREFLATNPLKNFWIPLSLANSLDEQDWSDCDDAEFARYGLRCFLVRLFYRNFIAAVFEYCESHSNEIDPEIHQAVTAELAALQPVFAPKYIPEPVVYQSEKERESKIRQRELADEVSKREIQNLTRWQIEQLKTNLTL